MAFTAYCNQGFEGHFREALASIAPASANEDAGDGEAAAAETDGAADSPDTYVATAAAKASGIDVFDALRERNFEQGILAELGRDQGCVAFQPSAFYGRFVGEIVYSLNDALRRLEGLTSYYVMSGDGKTLRNYYAELGNGLGRIGKDLDGIVGFCKRKLAQG